MTKIKLNPTINNTKNKNSEPIPENLSKSSKAILKVVEENPNMDFDEFLYVVDDNMPKVPFADFEPTGDAAFDEFVNSAKSIPFTEKQLLEESDKFMQAAEKSKPEIHFAMQAFSDIDHLTKDSFKKASGQILAFAKECGTELLYENFKKTFNLLERFLK